MLMRLVYLLTSVVIFFLLFCFLFKQKTAYEMRISDWSSDVCSSDLQIRGAASDRLHHAQYPAQRDFGMRLIARGIEQGRQQRDNLLHAAVRHRAHQSRIAQFVDRGSDLLRLDRKSTRLNSSH